MLRALAFHFSWLAYSVVMLLASLGQKKRRVQDVEMAEGGEEVDEEKAEVVANKRAKVAGLANQAFASQ